MLGSFSAHFPLTFSNLFFSLLTIVLLVVSACPSIALGVGQRRIPILDPKVAAILFECHAIKCSLLSKITASGTPNLMTMFF